jgi:hypothetical protein
MSKFNPEILINYTKENLVNMIIDLNNKRCKWHRENKDKRKEINHRAYLKRKAKLAAVSQVAVV